MLEDEKDETPSNKIDKVLLNERCYTPQDLLEKIIEKNQYTSKDLECILDELKSDYFKLSIDCNHSLNCVYTNKLNECIRCKKLWKCEKCHNTYVYHKKLLYLYCDTKIIEHSCRECNNVLEIETKN